MAHPLKMLLDLFGPTLDQNPWDYPEARAVVLLLVTAAPALAYLSWRLAARHAGRGRAAALVALGITLYVLALTWWLSPLRDDVPGTWYVWLQCWMVFPGGVILGAFCGAGVATVIPDNALVRQVAMRRVVVGLILFVFLLVMPGPGMWLPLAPLCGLLAMLGGREALWLGADALPPGAA